MPQTMQQKRKGSLERLKESLVLNDRELNNTKYEEVKTHYSRRITNLTRMIDDTEYAIQHNQ